MDFVVFCRLTEMQIAMYRRFLKSKSIKKVIAGAGTTTLTAISSLKKLANRTPIRAHALGTLDVDPDSAFLSTTAPDPGLVHDKCQQRSEGFEDSLELFPPGFTTQSYRPELAFRPEMSGKFQVLDTMLAWIRAKTNDKVPWRREGRGEGGEGARAGTGRERGRGGSEGGEVTRAGRGARGESEGEREPGVRTGRERGRVSGALSSPVCPALAARSSRAHPALIPRSSSAHPALIERSSGCLPDRAGVQLHSDARPL